MGRCDGLGMGLRESRGELFGREKVFSLRDLESIEMELIVCSGKSVAKT